MSATVDPTRNWVSPTGNHYWYRKRREVERLLVRHVHLSPGALIVDFGAGNGRDITLLTNLYPHASVLALEGSQESADDLNQQFGDLPNLRSEQADLTQRLPLEDEAVDLGYCSEVLEHIPEPDALFAEAHRVLKPNGCFLVTTKNEPNVLQKSFWLRRRLPGHRSGPTSPEQADANGEVELYGHISLFKIKEWESSLSRAGFELVDARRGALMYGARPWLDKEGMLAVYFAAEALIDLAPTRLSRRLSDQLIGLYRRV
jgi:SAM-dependent methyltransferase